MLPTEPARAWQDQKHQRILQEDITAFAELSEVALPYFVSFLQKLFPNSHPHQCETVAIDCLLNYQRKPKQYNPEKLSLFAFFRMATRRDMLNVLDKEQRVANRLTRLEDVTLHSESSLLSDETILEEWLKQHTNLSHEEILTELDKTFSQQEMDILLLMLEGERSTAVFADIMDIADLDTAVQRCEVKKMKDRITKRLQRLGTNLSNF